MKPQNLPSKVHLVEQSAESKGDQGNDSQLMLAFELFDQLSPEDGRISEADTPIGYNRADILLDIDKMSLLGRRALDTVYFIVANADSHHKYITVSRDDGLKSYAIDKGFFLWLMNYTSRNWVHLQDALNQSHDAKVTVSIGEQADAERAFISKKGKSITNPENWVTVSLVIASGVNRDKVFFQIHPKLESFIRSPDRYHFLDLRFVFSTLYGRLLYEKISRYADVGETPWFSLEELRVAMKNDSPSLQNMRYMGQKVLGPAIEDINKHTDLQVERIDGKNPTDRRRVDRVKFKIERKPVLLEQAAMDEMATGYDILVSEFGLNQTQMRTINKNREEWTRGRIDQAIEYTRYQLQKGKIKASPAGYLMKALQEGYVLGTAMLELDKQADAISAKPADTPPNNASQKTPVTYESVESDVLYAQKSQAGLRTLRTLGTQAQKDLYDEFVASPAARLAASGDQVDIKSIQDIEQLTSTPLLSRSFGAFVFNQHKKKT